MDPDQFWLAIWVALWMRRPVWNAKGPAIQQLGMGEKRA